MQNNARKATCGKANKKRCRFYKFGTPWSFLYGASSKKIMLMFRKIFSRIIPAMILTKKTRRRVANVVCFNSALNLNMCRAISRFEFLVFCNFTLDKPIEFVRMFSSSSPYNSKWMGCILKSRVVPCNFSNYFFNKNCRWQHNLAICMMSVHSPLLNVVMLAVFITTMIVVVLSIICQGYCQLFVRIKSLIV